MSVFLLISSAAKYAAKQHRQRAETIARTEMAFAYNHGMDDAIKEMMSAGLMGRMKKVWRVAPGCCGICADLDGMEVDVGESFQFRGRTLFDGAKEVPPAHPNCRCVVMYEEAENSGLTFGGEDGIINYAREDDLFSTVGEPDVNENVSKSITPETIMNELEKSSVGKSAIETLQNLPETPIIDYTTYNPGVKAQEENGAVRLFVKSCKDNTTAACALIHECTHYKYGIGQSQWAECVCVAQEIKHRRGRDYLTFSERRTIIKAVKDVYPEYNWRKGGIIHGRRTK